MPITLPCGHCRGCRLERSRQWAMRCMHEASMHRENSYLTLTYDDEHIPEDYSLRVEDFQNFIKRLRHSYEEKKIRYYHCGEYGDDKEARPHYHAIMFGIEFEDKKFHKKGKHGHDLYKSEKLNKIWGHGYVLIGEVTFKSAAYVARYIMKKVMGDKADEHYLGRKPEYTTMSRRPGIGKTWLDKFKNDVYPNDYVITNGKKSRPPKFYDSQIEKESEIEYKKIKLARIKNSLKYEEDKTHSKLMVKQFILNQKIHHFKRDLKS